MNREEQIKLYCEEMGFPMGSCSSINSVKAQTAADAIRWADEHPRRTTDWNQVRIQAAIAAMQGMLANPDYNYITMEYGDIITHSAMLANGLIEELKGE